MWLTIKEVHPEAKYTLRLTLSDESVVSRDVSELLEGRVFGPLKDKRLFSTAKARYGGVVWKNGADISPDLLIWGNEPPKGAKNPPVFLKHYPGSRQARGRKILTDAHAAARTPVIFSSSCSAYPPPAVPPVLRRPSASSPSRRR